jgi:hypothetical protein
VKTVLSKKLIARIIANIFYYFILIMTLFISTYFTEESSLSSGIMAQKEMILWYCCAPRGRKTGNGCWIF